MNAWHGGARWRGVGDCAKFRTFAKATVQKDGADDVDVIKDKTLLPDGTTAKGWAKGTFAEMTAHVLKTRDKLPAFFTGSTHGASAVMRVQLDPSPRLRMMLKTMPIPDSTIDARTAKIPRKRIPRPK